MIQILKLINGEDIIGEIVSDKELSVVVSNPLKFKLVSRQTLDGAMESLSLSKWLEPMSSDTEIEIKKSFIGVIADSSIGMNEFYVSSLQYPDESDTREPEPDDLDLEMDFLQRLMSDSDEPSIH